MLGHIKMDCLLNEETSGHSCPFQQAWSCQDMASVRPTHWAPCVTLESTTENTA